ncbi:MAG: hypothetical protein ACOCVQ_03525 [Bacillota bacterium]
MMNTEQIMEVALELAGLDEVTDDSGIIVPCDKVEKVMMGIDIETADLFLARELGADLVIGHHPATGSPALGLYKVMKRQVELMMRCGIPINKAQKVLQKRIDSTYRGAHPKNFAKLEQAARLMEMPFMNIHMPLDIVTENTTQAHLDSQLEEESTVGDVVEALKMMPEYQGEPAGPVIRAGSAGDYAGKVFVSFAGGTNGGPDVMKAYFEAGVGTLVLMHIPEDALSAVKEQGIGNIVIAGHMRSDSIGINKFLDALEERGVEVVSMGGVIRR